MRAPMPTAPIIPPTMNTIQNYNSTLIRLKHNITPIDCDVWIRTAEMPESESDALQLNYTAI